jgi:hypothetical protein
VQATPRTSRGPLTGVLPSICHQSDLLPRHRTARPSPALQQPPQGTPLALLAYPYAVEGLGQHRIEVGPHDRDAGRLVERLDLDRTVCPAVGVPLVDLRDLVPVEVVFGDLVGA